MTTGCARSAAPAERKLVGCSHCCATPNSTRVLTSPYVRCIETVVPLAGARRLAIEPDDALAEGGDLDLVLAIVRKHIGNGAVLCSHGDVIPAVLSHLAAKGVDIGADPRCPKGCTWVLEAGGGVDVTKVSYLPPPPDWDE